MKKNHKMILILEIIAVSVLIILSVTAVSSVQYVSSEKIIYKEGRKVNQFIVDIIDSTGNFNNEQRKRIDTLLNESNFPLVTYYANESALYMYIPENNTLKIVVTGDMREMINSCCCWSAVEDIIIVALNQDEDSPEWTDEYDPDMPCFNIDFNASPIDIPLNILCDFNETLLKICLGFQHVEPLLLVQLPDENKTICTPFFTMDFASINILSLLRAYYLTTFAEFMVYVVYFFVTLHQITPLLMAQLFYCCVVINTNTNPATNIVFSQYGHVFILEFIVFIAESYMIYWLCKTIGLRITFPGAVNLSLLANIYSFITASSR
jgi:hypothetical protein